MNICFLSTCQFNEFSGGIDRVCCQLSREFFRRGHKIVYVYGTSSVLGCPAEGCEGEGQYQFPHTIWDDRNISFFSDVIAKHNVDVVVDVAFVARYHDVAYRAKTRTPFKLITTYHGDPESNLKELHDKFDFISFSSSGIEKFFHKIKYLCRLPISYYLRKRSFKNRISKCINETDHYILLTSSYAETVKNYLPPQIRNKVGYIYNPVGFDGLIQRVDLQNKQNQVIFVGRMDFQKRVDRLLRVWSHIWPLFPDWELVLVGDGDFLENYKQYSCKLSLQNVHFVGHANGPEYMSRAKILTMQSSHEGFPMVLLDAMKCGTVPILFNSFASANVIVKDGFNGMLVEPFSERLFSKKLISLMSDDSLLKSMQKNCLSSIVQFDVRAIVDSWETLFKS